jgi:hypothetical protein
MSIRLYKDTLLLNSPRHNLGRRPLPSPSVCCFAFASPSLAPHARYRREQSLRNLVTTQYIKVHPPFVSPRLYKDALLLNSPRHDSGWRPLSSPSVCCFAFSSASLAPRARYQQEQSLWNLVNTQYVEVHPPSVSACLYNVLLLLLNAPRHNSGRRPLPSPSVCCFAFASPSLAPHARYRREQSLQNLILLLRSYSG